MAWLGFQRLLPCPEYPRVAAGLPRYRGRTAHASHSAAVARVLRWMLCLGRWLLALFLGVGLANVIRDGVGTDPGSPFFLPRTTDLRPRPSRGILDWYAIPGGLLAVASLALHGALYLTLKTQNELHARARRWVVRLWPAVVLLSVVSVPATAIARPASLAD